MHQLTPESWIRVVPHAIECTEEDFIGLWDLCPDTKDNIMMFGNLIPIPRFQKLYGLYSYKYSGIKMEAEPDIPELVERCIDYAKVNWPEFNWNGALVNWYPDGSSYIGPHSDDEKDLEKGAPILSFSFGSVRTFRIKNKKTGQNMDFPTKNCSVIIMGGSMQGEYKHEITKTKKKIGPRINVTVRCFSK